jgi:hypothetical protein
LFVVFRDDGNGSYFSEEHNIGPTNLGKLAELANDPCVLSAVEVENGDIEGAKIQAKRMAGL